MNIIEKEVTRWELPSVDIANVYCADRNADIQLWWTPVEELEASVLNVFSPSGHVFWNFAQYEPFGDGAHAYIQHLVRNESTVSILNDLIRDAGAELKSDLASDLLGGFTRYFGDRYEPRRRHRPAFLPYDRHISLAVPEPCQLMVSRYFREQVRVFGDSATKQCPEDVSLRYSNDESDRTLSSLLVKGVFLMTESERNAQLALIRSGVDLLADDRPEHYCFTGNAIALRASGIEPNCEWLDDFAEIARFRVEMAIRHYKLGGVEKLKRDLDHSDWGLLCLADLRDELRGRLATVLARYPVIETNPFELWKYKEYVI
jgi:hypothetical protein